MKHLSLFFLVVSLSLSSLALGDILQVPDEYSTIQMAVDVAEDGDTVLVSPGTYTENVRIRTQNIVLASTFILDFNLDAISSTIIDGGNSFAADTGSAISISGAWTSPEIMGFTLTGGTGTSFATQGGANAREGGGIYSRSASPYIHHNIFINNVVDPGNGYSFAGGAGLSTFYGSPVIENNVFIHNYGWYGGGFVINYSTATIRNNIVAENSSRGDYGGGAGLMIYTPNNSVTFNNNTVFGNSNTNNDGGDGIAILANSRFYSQNNIIYENGNTEISFEGSSNVNVNYSIVNGGFIGIMNQDVDPLFNYETLEISSGSQAIDSGNPDSTYNDVEDPESDGIALYPSMGTILNDRGAYGGPYRSPYGLPHFELETTKVDHKEFSTIPSDMYLDQNYPNPFNPTTSISFGLSTNQVISLDVFNVNGQLVASLINGNLKAGRYTEKYDFSQLSSGLYIYRLKGESSILSKRFMLLK